MWAPDGRRLFFQSTRTQVSDLFSRAPDGTAEEIIVVDGRPKAPTDISADGRLLLYNASDAGTPTDVWVVPLTGERTPHRVVNSAFDDRDAVFSPDGRWIAYQSNESGRTEVYVRPFDTSTPRFQVSTAGGQQVRWARSGELFYLANDGQLTAVALSLSPGREPALRQATTLFRTAFDPVAARQTRPQFVVAADGRRFLLNLPNGPSTPPVISVVLGWRGEPQAPR